MLNSNLNKIEIRSQTVDNVTINASSSAVIKFNNFPIKTGTNRVVIDYMFLNASSGGVGYSGVTRYSSEGYSGGINQYVHNFYTSTSKVKMTITVAYFPTEWFK